MPHTYKLYKRAQGGPGWNNASYDVQISGNTVNSVTAQGKSAGGGSWTTITGATYAGTGTPDSPQDGDTLGLPATVGNGISLSGSGTYSSTGSGSHGGGYYTSQGPRADDGDWCATSN